MDARRCAMRLTLFGTVLFAAQLQAAAGPVSVGVNANSNPWLTRSTNAGWARIDIGWWDIEPQPDMWNFGGTDNRIAEYEANGLKILAILHYVPAWAGGGPRGNVPPLTTTDWSEFVRRLAQRYPNRIAAYEIWNEPDDQNSGSNGIGWDRNIEEFPRYVDFLRAAAMEIRTYSPASLVVGPAYTSRADSASKQNRRRRIFEQIRDTIYGNGPGYSFLDVVSFHNNGRNDTSSSATAWELRSDSLMYLSNYCYPLRLNPVWVTEYGWRSNEVGENGQREKICNITKYYSAKDPLLQSWNVRASFIYLQRGDGTSQSIFRSDNVWDAKPVVTQYMRALSYPATQNPAYTNEFPTCAGVFTSAATASESLVLTSPEEVAERFAELGLEDPTAALPSEYSLERAELTGNTIDVTFAGPDDDTIRVAASPRATSDAASGSLSEGGAEWTTERAAIKIVRPMSERGPRGLVAALASHIDRPFGMRCSVRARVADRAAMRRLGVRPPSAPHGFAKSRALLEVQEASAGCGSRAGALGDFDFLWEFEDGSGAVIRAGVYRYGEGFAGEIEHSASAHWGDGTGIRYWVAIDGVEPTPSLREAMWATARSMYPKVPFGP